MNYSLIFNTVKHLKCKQIAYQVLYRLIKPEYKFEKAPTCIPQSTMLSVFPCKGYCSSGNSFTFLNLSKNFDNWNDISNGPLWAYNLNYMDWLLQESMTYETGAKWIDKFINDIPKNKLGLDPYPMALRGINWIKFISIHRELISKDRLHRWNDSLYSQYQLLLKKLEYHLLGNHLLEDAYSLFIASVYFCDKIMYVKASKLLRQQLDEQILPDGAHYEQSPMYHCILLDRLLDCYNVSKNNAVFENQSELTMFLNTKASLMLGHLASIVWADGGIPLLNDSAEGIAPSPSDIFSYADRLNISWQKISLKECGYRKFRNDVFEAIVDVGNMTARYQPGHSHADTFNYELRIDGRPFIVDTGISTYNKTTRRQLERGTCAHNTVTVNDCNSSEVWGGFRVGQRARVRLLSEAADSISASHNGFGDFVTHERKFTIENGGFNVCDRVSGMHDCKNYIHFAPEIDILAVSDNRIVTNLAEIDVDGANHMELIEGKISVEYNRFLPIKIAVLHFGHEMKYKIKRI